MGALWGLTKIKAKTFDWNFAFKYFLTSFGTALDTNLFFKNQNWSYFVSLHHYLNSENYFPGFELELVSFPGSLLGGENGLRARAGS